MLGIKMICVGKMREKHFIQAFDEYAKRLGAYCRFELVEPEEVRLPDRPSEKEIASALDKEASVILNNIDKGSFIIALCVEGKQMDSESFSRFIQLKSGEGFSRFCCVIGGSYGLSDKVKQRADLKLSMSPMTFPHHLARVMFAEQLYRSFKIAEGSKYHK